MVVIPNIAAGKTVCINTAEAGNPHQLMVSMSKMLGFVALQRAALGNHCKQRFTRNLRHIPCKAVES